MNGVWPAFFSVLQTTCALTCGRGSAQHYYTHLLSLCSVGLLSWHYSSLGQNRIFGAGLESLEQFLTGEMPCPSCAQQMVSMQ